MLLTKGITLSVRSSTVVESDEVFEPELELDELFTLELVDDVEFEYPTERGLYPADDQHSKSLE